MTRPLRPGPAGYAVYNLCLRAALLLCAPAWIPWMLASRKRRKNFLDRLGCRFPELPEPTGRGRVWVHAVSVGETLAAAPLVRRLRDSGASRDVVFSTVTVTGREVAERSLRGAVDGLVYFPFDLPGTCGRCLDRIRPDVVAIMETEIWPNFLAECARRGIPVALLNARLSEKSLRGYARFRGFTVRTLGLLAAIGAQTDEDARRFLALGADPSRVSVTGNVKFDIAPPPAFTPLRDWMAERKSRGAKWIVAGSTHDGEEGAVLSAFGRARAAHGDLSLVLAPRHPERFDAVAALCEREGSPAARWSAGRPAEDSPCSVLLLDTMGELLSAYAAADAAFVGGSLVPKGGHNVLEPALFGIPPVVGPYMQNFREIEKIFLDADALVQVRDGEQLGEAFVALFSDPERRRATGGRALSCLERFRGATERSFDIVSRLLSTRMAP